MKVHSQHRVEHVTQSWVNQFADQLYSWAYYKTMSKETAEDLVQETFISAYSSFDTCRDVERPKTWLFTILNNKIIDYYRKSARENKAARTIYQEDRLADIDSQFDMDGRWNISEIWVKEEAELLDREDFNSLLSTCLDELPTQWRTALLSKFLLERKSVDICKELNITPSNYWQLIHRAKLMMKLCLQKYWDK